MCYFFLIMSCTPSLIVLLDEAAFMYDAKDCNLMPQAEVCNEAN